MQHALLIQKAHQEAPFVCVQRDTQVLTEDHVLDAYQGGTSLIQGLHRALCVRRDPIQLQMLK